MFGSRRNNSNLHDLFNVIESEGVDLLDSVAYSQFENFKNDGNSMYSKEKGQNTNQ